MRRIKKICLVVASELTATVLLREQIAALSKHYDVTLIANTRNPELAAQNGWAIKVLPVAIEREIRLGADLLALYRLFALFRKHRFDLIHSITPKAGLLAMLAGKLAAVRFRIHTFTGQVWATRKGLSRQILKLIDRLLAVCATHLLTDGYSQRQYLIEQRIVSPENLAVLADGSLSGVNTKRFHPDKTVRDGTRKRLGIGESDVLLLFLGRLNRDKGVLDLASAFANVGTLNNRLQLLLVGPDEGKLEEPIREICAGLAERIRFVRFTDTPESYVMAADILCLPSYREGFNNVVIEAAACGVPAIGSRVYGIVDTIIENETGILFPPGDVRALGEAISDLATHPRRRVELGEKALARARKEFSSGRLLEAWLAFYDSLSREET